MAALVSGEVSPPAAHRTVQGYPPAAAYFFSLGLVTGS